MWVCGFIGVVVGIVISVAACMIGAIWHSYREARVAKFQRRVARAMWEELSKNWDHVRFHVNKP